MEFTIKRQQFTDADLRKKRAQNDKRLKSIFESIFEKYEKNFDGIGDEIDLQTGNIVVDNGHLSGMSHEKDLGDKKGSFSIGTECEGSSGDKAFDCHEDSVDPNHGEARDQLSDLKATLKGGYSINFLELQANVSDPAEVQRADDEYEDELGMGEDMASTNMQPLHVQKNLWQVPNVETIRNNDRGDSQWLVSPIQSGPNPVHRTIKSRLPALSPFSRADLAGYPQDSLWAPDAKMQRRKRVAKSGDAQESREPSLRASSNGPGEHSANSDSGESTVSETSSREPPEHLPDHLSTDARRFTHGVEFAEDGVMTPAKTPPVTCSDSIAIPDDKVVSIKEPVSWRLSDPQRRPEPFSTQYLHELPDSDSPPLISSPCATADPELPVNHRELAFNGQAMHEGPGIREALHKLTVNQSIATEGKHMLSSTLDSNRPDASWDLKDFKLDLLEAASATVSDTNKAILPSTSPPRFHEETAASKSSEKGSRRYPPYPKATAKKSSPRKRASGLQPYSNAEAVVENTETRASTSSSAQPTSRLWGEENEVQSLNFSDSCREIPDSQPPRTVGHTATPLETHADTHPKKMDGYGRMKAGISVKIRQRILETEHPNSMSPTRATQKKSSAASKSTGPRHGAAKTRVHLKTSNFDQPEDPSIYSFDEDSDMDAKAKSRATPSKPSAKKCPRTESVFKEPSARAKNPGGPFRSSKRPCDQDSFRPKSRRRPDPPEQLPDYSDDDLDLCREGLKPTGTSRQVALKGRSKIALSSAIAACSDDELA